MTSEVKRFEVYTGTVMENKEKVVKQILRVYYQDNQVKLYDIAQVFAAVRIGKLLPFFEMDQD